MEASHVVYHEALDEEMRMRETKQLLAMIGCQVTADGLGFDRCAAALITAGTSKQIEGRGCRYSRQKMLIRSYSCN